MRNLPPAPEKLETQGNRPQGQHPSRRNPTRELASIDIGAVRDLIEEAFAARHNHQGLGFALFSN